MPFSFLVILGDWTTLPARNHNALIIRVATTIEDIFMINYIGKFEQGKKTI